MASTLASNNKIFETSRDEKLCLIIYPYHSLKLFISGFWAIMAKTMKRTVIYFLRNDLRTHDNECLQWANRNAEHIIPLYCFDPNHFKGTYKFGFPKTGKYRSKFLVECVKDLKATFQKLGSNLIIRQEDPVSAIKELVDLCSKEAPVTSVVYQKEVTREEIDVESQLGILCKKMGIEAKPFWGATLFHIDDIPFSCHEIPDTYTTFRKKVENVTAVRHIIPVPDGLKPLPPVKGNLGEIPHLQDLGVKDENVQIDSRSAFPYSGGETTALERLNSYLWETDAVATYKKTRNGLIGQAYSTKFSPWLSSGSLSPRKIYNDIKLYESNKTANDSTYWVIFELIWRDYFKFVCWKYGDRVFYPSGIMGRQVQWKKDMELFKKWSQGSTGVPFVDANMRELLETGWMSNRGRQNVASFLIKDLGLDWRLGAEWFESMLLDHDVCSNYGNWNYAAGIGNDPRENRKFNMIKQGMDYDGNGDFVRLWVPELSNIKDSSIHMPWTVPITDLKLAGVELGNTYPRPVVVAPEWGRHKHKAGHKQSQGGDPKTQRNQRGIDFYFKSGSNRK